MYDILGLTHFSLEGKSFALDYKGHKVFYFKKCLFHTQHTSVKPRRGRSFFVIVLQYIFIQLIEHNSQGLFK